MKRINLSVDLEDNKLFDKSVTEAAEAYAKQIARGAILEALESEIDRLVKIRMAEWTTYQRNNPLLEIINTKVDREVRKALDAANISKLYLGHAVDKQIDDLFNTIDVNALIVGEIHRILPQKVFEILSGSGKEQ